MNRRTFIKSIGILAAGALIDPYELFAKQKKYDFSKFSDKEVLARMLFGEARELYKLNEEELTIIGLTAINRKEKFKKKSLKEVILSPKQYSCFNQYNSQLQGMKNLHGKDLEAWKKSIQLSKEILEGKVQKLNYGQTHYHKKDMREYPYWAEDPRMKKIPVKDFFEHYFYQEL